MNLENFFAPVDPNKVPQKKRITLEYELELYKDLINKVNLINKSPEDIFQAAIEQLVKE